MTNWNIKKLVFNLLKSNKTTNEFVFSAEEKASLFVSLYNMLVLHNQRKVLMKKTNENSV